MFLGQINTFFGDVLSVFEKIIIDQDRSSTMNKIRAIINRISDPPPAETKIEGTQRSASKKVEYLKNIKQTMLSKLSVPH